MNSKTVLSLIGHLLFAAGVTCLGFIGAVVSAMGDSIFLLHVSVFGPSLLTLFTLALFTWLNKRSGGWRPYVTSAIVYALSSLWLVYAYIFFWSMYLITGTW